MKIKSIILPLFAVVAGAVFIASANAQETAEKPAGICEELAFIVNKQYRESDDLKFYTLPDAVCELDYGDFQCVWKKPRPEGWNSRKWVNSLQPEMKRLADQIQQCIKQDSFPGKWESFREIELYSGVVKGYFVRRYPFDHPVFGDNRNQELQNWQTINVCAKSGIMLKVHLEYSTGYDPEHGC